MFPARLLDVRHHDDGRVEPVWLEARDDVWLREMCAELRAFHGRRVEEADERIKEIVAPIARRHRVAARVVDAVWWEEKRRWKSRVDSPVAPYAVRKRVFELAGERSREEALATAGVELGLDVAGVERALYADRARERRLVAPGPLRSEAELREAYNLGLVQTLLARSLDVVATVRADLKAVVRFAKLLGLMTTFEEAPDGAVRMTVSGPLSVFHRTLKYSRAFATWFPAVVATPGWSLEARLFLEGEERALALDGGAPIPRTHALPRMHDSKLESRLDTDLRRCGGRFRLIREADVVRMGGGRVFFPDFALDSDRGRVVVEVAGFWTPEYVASKLAMLRAVRVPFVMCADRRTSPPELQCDPRVVLFDGAVDAAALLARCEAVLDEASKEEVVRCEERWASVRTAPACCPTSTSASSCPAADTRSSKARSST